MASWIKVSIFSVCLVCIVAFFIGTSPAVKEMRRTHVVRTEVLAKEKDKEPVKIEKEPISKEIPQPKSFKGRGILNPLIDPILNRMVARECYSGMRKFNRAEYLTHLLGGNPVFLHVTAHQGCLQCKAEWMFVSEKKLCKAACDHGIVLFEADLDDPTMLDDVRWLVRTYKTGGVPAYIYVPAHGDVKVEGNVLGTGDITEEFPDMAR